MSACFQHLTSQCGRFLMAEELPIRWADPRDDDFCQVEPRLVAAVGYSSCDVEIGKNMDLMSRISITDTKRNVSQVECASGRRYSIDPATALPITVRTLSVAMEATKDQPRAEDARANIDLPKELSDLHWHALSMNKVEAQLSTLLVQDPSAEQMDMEAQQFGQNALSKARSGCLFRMFGYIFGGFGSLLLIGGVLITITYKPLANSNPDRCNLALGVVLYATFAVQILFNGWQDLLAARTMSLISGILQDDCPVIRDGNHPELPVVNLVPGDK